MLTASAFTVSAASWPHISTLFRHNPQAPLWSELGVAVPTSEAEMVYSLHHLHCCAGEVGDRGIVIMVLGGQLLVVLLWRICVP